MRVYKPTQEELDNYDTRSEYCKEASKERCWLANKRAVVNRYSDCGLSFDKEYEDRRKAYLDKYAYFERNTMSHLDKNRHGWHNFIFTEKEVINKINEIENKSA